MQLTLPMRIISKKNSRRIIRRGNRIINIPSKRFGVFKDEAVLRLKAQSSEVFTGEVKIDVDYYMKGKNRQDIDNALTSLLDVLQDAGIILDDHQVVEAHIRKFSDNESWQVIINIDSI